MHHLKRFLLLSLVSVAAACSGGNGGSTDIRSLSNGPDLPEECNICWVDFETCADSGIDISLCEEAAVACAAICEAPPPPEDCTHCFAGYEACLEVAEQGMADVTDCVTGLESCLLSCESDEPEPPICEVVTPQGECWSSCEDYCSDRCFNDHPEPGPEPFPGGAACDADMYMECIQECNGTEPPPPPCYPDDRTGYCYVEDFCAEECPQCEVDACTDETAELCAELCPSSVPEPQPCQPGEYIPGCYDA